MSYFQYVSYSSGLQFIFLKNEELQLLFFAGQIFWGVLLRATMERKYSL